MKTTNDTSILAYETLGRMSRQHLRNLARNAGLPTGRDKKNTIAILVKAIREKKLRFKSVVTFNLPPANPIKWNHGGPALCMFKVRSYNDDAILIAPKKPSATAPMPGGTGRVGSFQLSTI